MAGRRTLLREAAASGIALHAGTQIRMKLLPAAGTGIVFRRTDLSDSPLIPALWSHVSETRLGTVLRAPSGAGVAVVEHLMAALSGAGIDDCMIEIDGPELPILDGDALSFLRIIDKAGVSSCGGDSETVRVIRPVSVSDRNASAALLPAEETSYYFEIDFPTPIIGRQSYSCVLTEEVFRRDIAPARTFGFLAEAEALRKAGLARGADLTNTLVIGEDGLMNPSLQRFSDEFVRHKILDAVGDMKLAGAGLLARFEGRRSSHALNNALLRALFSDPTNYARS